MTVLNGSFLEGVMRRMGFDGSWIRLIMNCITSVSYSVLINGDRMAVSSLLEVFGKEIPSPPTYSLCVQRL
jgi:hypothetical protein